MQLKKSSKKRETDIIIYAANPYEIPSISNKEKSDKTYYLDVVLQSTIDE